MAFSLAEIGKVIAAKGAQRQGLAGVLAELAIKLQDQGVDLRSNSERAFAEIAKQIGPNGLQPTGMSEVFGDLAALAHRDERWKHCREAFAEMNHALRQVHELRLIFYSCASVFDVSPFVMDRESDRSYFHSATSHR